MDYIKKLKNLINHGNPVSCALELDNILKRTEIPKYEPIFIDFLKKCNFILENKYELALVLNKCDYSDEDIFKYELGVLSQLRNRIRLRRVSWDSNLYEIKEIESVKRRKYPFPKNEEKLQKIIEDCETLETEKDLKLIKEEEIISKKNNSVGKYKILTDVTYEKVIYDYDISKILENFSEIKNPVSEILNDVRFINYIKNTTHKKL